MRKSLIPSLGRLIAGVIFLAVAASGCGGSYEETIAGVAVPVPKAMTKSSDKPVEMKILGFGAGQASFHGDMESDKIVEFYKKEMPARGWQPALCFCAVGAVVTMLGVRRLESGAVSPTRA